MLDLDGFRFYGCSLLMIYDGDKEAQEHYLRHSAQTPFGSGLGTHSEVNDNAGTLERVNEDERIETRHQNHHHHQHRTSRTLATTDEHDVDQRRSIPSHQSESIESDPNYHRSRPRRESEGESERLDSGSRTHSRSRSHSQSHDYHNDVQSHPHHHHHHHHHRASDSHSSNPKRIRGEVNIRVVDFAHTTTGLDFIPFPPNHVDPPDHELGKGYDTQLDPETGLNLARFPPKHPHLPDMGFVFGLKNVCAALEGIWRDTVGNEEVDRWMGKMGNKDVFVKAFGDGVGVGVGDGEDELST